jgi:sulfur carrier protein
MSPTFETGTGAAVEIQVNDEQRNIDVGTTVADLLEQMQMQPRYVAVERNRELIPRAVHAECMLEDGDRLEIVTLVGGG